MALHPKSTLLPSGFTDSTASNQCLYCLYPVLLPPPTSHTGSPVVWPRVLEIVRMPSRATTTRIFLPGIHRASRTLRTVTFSRFVGPSYSVVGTAHTPWVSVIGKVVGRMFMLTPISSGTRTDHRAAREPATHYAARGRGHPGASPSPGSRSRSRIFMPLRGSRRIAANSSTFSTAERGRIYRRCGCRDTHRRRLGAGAPAAYHLRIMRPFE